MNPVTLITGAAGFCGRHLMAFLVSQGGGARTVATDISPEAPAGCSDYISADISDFEQITEVVRTTRPAMLFHLAGRADGSPGEIYRTNVVATVGMLEAVRVHAPECRVLVVGSAAEYGDVPPKELPITELHPCRPRGDYATSKHGALLIGLDYARQHHLRVVAARPFNIIGPGMPPSLLLGAILARTKDALRSSELPVVKVGSLDSVRDFIAVEDVVAAYHRMLQSDFWGEVFNLCSGTRSCVRDVVTELLSHSPRPVQLETDPSLLRHGEAQVSYGSYEKAARAFGFVPRVQLAATLRQAWDCDMRDLELGHCCGA
jgi:GDP-4-dehydro-6-deoxy-D-mannose reductase